MNQVWWVSPSLAVLQRTLLQLLEVQTMLTQITAIARSAGMGSASERKEDHQYRPPSTSP